MYNPYGAVPEAIKDARVSLRDITADLLATKKMEGELTLAKTKAETEASLAAAASERYKLENEKDISRMNMQSDQFNRQLDQSGRQFQDNFSLAKSAQAFQQGPKFEQEKRLTDAQIAASRAQTAHSAAQTRQLQRSEQQITPRAYLQELGAPDGLFALFPNIQPDKSYQRWQLEDFKNQFVDFNKRNPAVALLSNMAAVQQQIPALVQQFHAEQDPAKKKVLGDRVRQLYEAQDVGQRLVLAANEPSAVEITRAAEKLGEDPQEFAKKVNEVRSAIQPNLRQWRMDAATFEISPTYGSDVTQYAKIIETKMPAGPQKTQLIAAHKALQDKVAAGDPAAAKQLYDNMKGWAQHLTSGTPTGKQAGTKPAPGKPAGESSLSKAAVSAVHHPLDPFGPANPGSTGYALDDIARAVKLTLNPKNGESKQLAAR